MKQPAIGTIVHHVKRAQGSDGVWRSVCLAAIVTGTDFESTSLTIFHSARIEHQHIVHNKHTGDTDTWHHRADCQPAGPDTARIAPENRCTAPWIDDDDNQIRCVLPAGHEFHDYGDAP